MNGDRELPARIQDLFDQHRDPLEATEVQQWLLDHPHQLEAFARLRASLLADAPRVMPVHRSWPWRVLPLAAALLLAAFVMVQQCGGPASAADRPLPRPDFATGGRILHFSTCTTVVGPDAASGQRATLCSVTTAGAAALQRVDTLTFEPSASPAIPLCVVMTRAEENQPSCIRP